MNILSRCAPDNCFAIDRVGDHRNWIPDFMSSSFSRARSRSCKLFARRVSLQRRISLTSLSRSSVQGQRAVLLPKWGLVAVEAGSACAWSCPPPFCHAMVELAL